MAGAGRRADGALSQPEAAGLPEVDAVVFDAGGVLLLPDPVALRRALAPLGAEPDDATCARAFYEATATVDRLGRKDWEAADSRLARVAGVPEERVPEAVGRLSFIFEGTEWRPLPGVAEALRRLQAAGYALAVVSNASGQMEEQLLRHEVCSVTGGPAADVAVVVDSHVVGVEKPDPAIFGFALHALGLPPQRCLYVGDSVHMDVGGARAAGLHVVHVDPFGLCVGGDHPHVTGVPELVRRLLGE